MIVLPREMTPYMDTDVHPEMMKIIAAAAAKK